MKSPWLLGSSDGLLRESLQQQQSILVYRPTSHACKERSVLFYCPITSFGKPEASNWISKAAQVRHFQRSVVLFHRNAASRRRMFASADTYLATTTESALEDWEEDDEYDKELTQYRGLVLDLSYRPINVVCWRRALCLEILEKADVLEYYDLVINSPTRPFAIPAVLRITSYVHSPKPAKLRLSLTRKNIFLRDKCRCQYCDAQDNLTVDHVVPLSRGGGWTWQNLVTACSKCNVRKGDKVLEEAKMRLRKIPQEPNALDGRDLLLNYAAFRRMQNASNMPTEWVSYLPKRFQPMSASSDN